MEALRFMDAAGARGTEVSSTTGSALFREMTDHSEKGAVVGRPCSCGATHVSTPPELYGCGRRVSEREADREREEISQQRGDSAGDTEGGESGEDCPTSLLGDSLRLRRDDAWYVT